MTVIAILTLIMAAGCQVLPAAFADLYGAVVLIDCLVMIVLGIPSAKNKFAGVYPVSL